MDTCIDCGAELTPENRSFSQPNDRCIDCVMAFFSQVEKFLDECIVEE